MENLFILICVAADDTKSKTDRQTKREREENKRQKTPPLSGCAHCGTVGWAQHRKRANKLYISNFMNSCWNGKRNGSREGREREREIGRGRQGTVARIDQFTNSTLNVQEQKQKHTQTTARVQFTTKNNNRRSSSRGRGRDSSSGSASDGA